MDEIDQIIRRHDEYQIEVKLDYELHRSLRKEPYAIDYFFFLPENLDVNAATYTKNQFYRDMLLYLRFKAPKLSLDELTDPADIRSPIFRLKAKRGLFLLNPTAQNAAALEYEFKILACVLKDALADRLRALEDALARGDESSAEETLSGTLDKARAAARAFRAARPDFELPSLPFAVRSTYAFVDEYVSILIDGHAHQTLQLLQRRTGAEASERRGRRVAVLIREELEHRRARNYPSIPEEGKDNEFFIFRLGVLKKFTSGALHLSVRTEKEGRGIEQVGMALGAGVAMVFASAVAYFTQKVYGALSLTFFTALVVSYMFKDRLKALAQGSFLRFRSERLMDLNTDVFDPSTGEKIGECRELVHFVPENKVDPAVLRLRDRDHITEIENTWRAEKVLHYVKRITLFPRRLDRHSRKTALTDIARFNVRNFLLKMDEPEKDVFILDGDASKKIVGTRVYHVNLIVKFTNLTGVRIERIRLVLDRNGLKRLEPVSGDQPPS